MTDVIHIKERTNKGMDLIPKDLGQAIELSKILANSSFVPSSYQKKPENVLVAMKMGSEIGLAPMQSLQHIAVISGKPALYGDAALAVVKAHPECDDVVEVVEDEIATCTVHRRGSQPVTRTFTRDDALRAGLWNKTGPWKQYPQRMLQMRARSFALRDAFPDALAGLSVVEEVQDIPVEKVVSEASTDPLPPKSADEKIIEALKPVEDEPAPANVNLDAAIDEIETVDAANDLLDRVTKMEFGDLDFQKMREVKRRIGERVKDLSK